MLVILSSSIWSVSPKSFALNVDAKSRKVSRRMICRIGNILLKINELCLPRARFVPPAKYYTRNILEDEKGRLGTSQPQL
jgi:hypothetical protein